MKAIRRKKVFSPSATLKPNRAAVEHFGIKKILVPLDFSAPSLKALQYACPLAKRLRASVHLVHVNDLVMIAPPLAPTFSLAPDFGHQLRRRLRRIGADCSPRISAKRCHVRNGRAFDQICREARVVDADLIVVATHGYKGLKHILLGSTAERVVRSALCPVLIVRERGREFVGKRPGAVPKIGHILVPTDFSEHAQHAMRYAIGFAKRFGARLTLFNMIYPQYYVTNPDYLPYDFGELFDEIRRAAKQDMAALVAATSFQGVRFKARIEEGHPAEHIVEFAAKNGVDLIITSTHGRTGLKHAVMGSIAEQLVRYAKCPVLVVPRAKDKARKGASR